VAAVIFGTIVLLVYVLLPTTTESSQPLWPFLDNIATSRASSEDAPERVALVVASQTTDNTSWLGESFPTWEKAIYLTDAPSNLSVPVNKGREGMVYLTSVTPTWPLDLPLTPTKLHHRQLRQPTNIHDLPACQQIPMAQR
jgi:hypothetical protein